MNRRNLTILALIAALLVGGYLYNRTAHPALAAPAATAAIPAENPATLPAAEPTPAAPSATPVSTPVPQPAAPQAVSLPDVDPHKAMGSKNAPVVMEIFSDFQCPACRQLYGATNRQLVDNYVNTGKVYLIHRDFPLPMHAYSKVAALYARAASQIGKFEPVEQTLFEYQDKWGQSGDVDGTVAAVLTPADMAKVRNLIKSPSLQALIDKDLALGRLDNVGQTPTTIFHTKDGQTYPVPGAMTFDALRTFIDGLAARK